MFKSGRHRRVTKVLIVLTVLVHDGSLHLVPLVGPVAGLAERQLGRHRRSLDQAVAVQVDPPGRGATKGEEEMRLGGLDYMQLCRKRSVRTR